MRRATMIAGPTVAGLRPTMEGGRGIMNPFLRTGDGQGEQDQATERPGENRGAAGGGAAAGTAQPATDHRRQHRARPGCRGRVRRGQAQPGFVDAQLVQFRPDGAPGERGQPGHQRAGQHARQGGQGRRGVQLVECRLGRHADQRGEARDAVYRRRVLPVLRGHALVHGDRAEPLRRLYHPPAGHPLLAHRRLSQYGDADVLQGRLRQQVPGVHAGGEPDGHPLPAAEPHQRAERALGQVRARPEQARLPVHRFWQQAHPQGPHVQSRGAGGQVVEPDRRGPARPVVTDHPECGRGGQLRHRRHLQDDQQPAVRRLLFPLRDGRAGQPRLAPALAPRPAGSSAGFRWSAGSSQGRGEVRPHADDAVLSACESVHRIGEQIHTIMEPSPTAPPAPEPGTTSARGGTTGAYARIMRWTMWRDLAPPRRVDLVIAAGLLAWGLPDVPWWWDPSGHAGSTPDILGSLALTLAMSVPFYWRRRFPVPVLAAAASVLAIRAGLHRNEISAFAAFLVGAYGLGAYSVTSRRYARWLGLTALALALFTLVTSEGRRLEAVPFALLGAAFVLGDAASARRGEMAAAVEAAHQTERTRIARELHDVVAHQLSAIAVQAGAARLAASAGPDGGNGEDAGAGQARLGGPGGLGTAAEVLGTVEQLSREALAELSHLLGALRREPAGGAGVPPAPTLAELDTLIATTRAAGVPTELAIAGRPRPLSPGAELSCYRIVSEALANVAKHAPGAPTSVTLQYAEHRLEIDVHNAAPPHGHRPAAAPAGTGGLGLRGMRERAELYGGVLAAGASPGGGFTVTAVIPFAEAASEEAGPAQAVSGRAVSGGLSGEPA